MNLEETPKFNKAEEESSLEISEMPPEDFQEMIDQTPVHKEMLEERKIRLEELKRNPETNLGKIQNLETEIAELEEEISEREDISMGA